MFFLILRFVLVRKVNPTHNVTVYTARVIHIHECALT